MFFVLGLLLILRTKPYNIQKNPLEFDFPVKMAFSDDYSPIESLISQVDRGKFYHTHYHSTHNRNIPKLNSSQVNLITEQMNFQNLLNQLHISQLETDKPSNIYDYPRVIKKYLSKLKNCKFSSFEFKNLLHSSVHMSSQKQIDANLLDHFSNEIGKNSNAENNDLNQFAKATNQVSNENHNQKHERTENDQKLGLTNKFSSKQVQPLPEDRFIETENDPQEEIFTNPSETRLIEEMRYFVELEPENTQSSPPPSSIYSPKQYHTTINEANSEYIYENPENYNTESNNEYLPYSTPGISTDDRTPNVPRNPQVSQDSICIVSDQSQMCPSDSAVFFRNEKDFEIDNYLRLEGNQLTIYFLAHINISLISNSRIRNKFRFNIFGNGPYSAYLNLSVNATDISVHAANCYLLLNTRQKFDEVSFENCQVADAFEESQIYNLDVNSLVSDEVSLENVYSISGTSSRIICTQNIGKRIRSDREIAIRTYSASFFGVMTVIFEYEEVKSLICSRTYNLSFETSKLVIELAENSKFKETLMKIRSLKSFPRESVFIAYPNGYLTTVGCTRCTIKSLDRRNSTNLLVNSSNPCLKLESMGAIVDVSSLSYISPSLISDSSISIDSKDGDLLKINVSAREVKTLSKSGVYASIPASTSEKNNFSIINSNKDTPLEVYIEPNGVSEVPLLFILEDESKLQVKVQKSDKNTKINLKYEIRGEHINITAPDSVNLIKVHSSPDIIPIPPSTPKNSDDPDLKHQKKLIMITIIAGSTILVMVIVTIVAAVIITLKKNKKIDSSTSSSLKEYNYSKRNSRNENVFNKKLKRKSYKSAYYSSSDSDFSDREYHQSKKQKQKAEKQKQSTNYWDANNW